MDEKAPLPGHEKLTMGDQMRAAGTSAKLRTNPATGAVENPRRKLMQAQIQYRANQAGRAQEFNSMKDTEF